MSIELIETENVCRLGDYEPALEWWWAEDIETGERMWLELTRMYPGAKTGDIIVVKGVSDYVNGREVNWHETSVTTQAAS